MVHQPMSSEPKLADAEWKKEGQRVTFQDIEAQTPVEDGEGVRLTELKLSLKDVNPIPPMWAVLRRLNNLTILFASGTSWILIPTSSLHRLIAKQASFLASVIAFPIHAPSLCTMITISMLYR